MVVGQATETQRLVRSCFGGLSIPIGPQIIASYDTSLTEEKETFSSWGLVVRDRFAKHWQLKGSILNLFDREVEWVRGYLMPERNFHIGLTYNF